MIRTALVCPAHGEQPATHDHINFCPVDGCPAPLQPIDIIEQPPPFSADWAWTYESSSDGRPLLRRLLKIGRRSR